MKRIVLSFLMLAMTFGAMAQRVGYGGSSSTGSLDDWYLGVTGGFCIPVGSWDITIPGTVGDWILDESPRESTLDCAMQKHTPSPSYGFYIGGVKEKNDNLFVSAKMLFLYSKNTADFEFHPSQDFFVAKYGTGATLESHISFGHLMVGIGGGVKYMLTEHLALNANLMVGFDLNFAPKMGAQKLILANGTEVSIGEDEYSTGTMDPMEGADPVIVVIPNLGVTYDLGDRFFVGADVYYSQRLFSIPLGKVAEFGSHYWNEGSGGVITGSKGISYGVEKFGLNKLSVMLTVGVKL